MTSLWEQTWEHTNFAPLEGDVNTDVLIIGGGMAGVLCAHLLHHAGVPYMLAEAETVCSGITKNTTAKLTSQHGLIYDKLIRTLGVERAKGYLSANQEALQKYRVLCRGIDCDFEEKIAYVYALNDRRKLEQELAALEKLGFHGEFAEHPPLPFSTAGAVKFSNQAQFHPLKFVSAISKGLHIYEHTRVLELSGNTAVTDRGDIRGEKIIVATHFPFLNRYGAYFLKMYQQRSYVLALEEAAQVEGMYIEAEPGGLSFRNYGNLLLLGGGGHRTGKAGGGWEYLRREAQRYYPAARECYHWAAQDCMTLDGMAYVGPYSRGTRNLYVATGFHKWGMTGSMAAATLLRDMVLEKENPYARVFATDRPMLRPQLGVNAWDAMRNLLTFRTPRCPHLGCALVWNPQEHAWECPCHGSRFSQSGKVLDNPANKNMKKK